MQDIDLSDIPETSSEWWAKAVVRYPSGKAPAREPITLQLDSAVIKWFRGRGKGYQALINALLRAYMDEHRPKKGARRE